ncbi:hypothetical protein [Haploplasma axanthum]|uniref:Uncharacterized protein n=1 Tax=Haploplasma axanthum TaxID=29552 RepID=A0A449BFI1_HAPAX|nr:hypothetical protein [Haploplasma axanthum]VEU81188.1 Uncharacterised protein [Haploplasma axanthum]
MKKKIIFGTIMSIIFILSIILSIQLNGKDYFGEFKDESPQVPIQIISWVVGVFVTFYLVFRKKDINKIALTGILTALLILYPLGIRRLYELADSYDFLYTIFAGIILIGYAVFIVNKQLNIEE